MARPHSHMDPLKSQCPLRMHTKISHVLELFRSTVYSAMQQSCKVRMQEPGHGPFDEHLFCSQLLCMLSPFAMSGWCPNGFDLPGLLSSFFPCSPTKAGLILMQEHWFHPLWHADTFKYRQIDQYMIYAYLHTITCLPFLRPATGIYSMSWKLPIAKMRYSSQAAGNDPLALPEEVVESVPQRQGATGIQHPLHTGDLAIENHCISLSFSNQSEVSLSESSTCFAGGSNDVLRTCALRILW